MNEDQRMDLVEAVHRKVLDAITNKAQAVEVLGDLVALFAVGFEDTLPEYTLVDLVAVQARHTAGNMRAVRDMRNSLDAIADKLAGKARDDDNS